MDQEKKPKKCRICRKEIKEGEHSYIPETAIVICVECEIDDNEYYEVPKYV